MDLAELQKRLSQQYARLRDLRATENYPVYAIEHGLSAEESAVALKLLNGHLKSYTRADRAYWLVWIAAAAEVGYRYDGLEYWDSFAEAFPLWPLYGDRNQIRNWYKRFASEFGGVSPSGPWARHFPIIAWPITQAILPRYLQRHFADHLYQLRHALARSGELTLEEIGDLLNERYFGGSSRFEGFLQQKKLTARIVMALGLEDVADAIAPIEAATLERIVRDFDKLGSSGSRLREARRVLRDTRFVNSFKHGFVASPSNREGVDHGRADRAEKPRLAAYPSDAQSWNVALTVPDLATPLKQKGLSPHDLERTRMRFRPHGAGNAWVPARALFSYTGQSTETLDAYPTADRQIFEFDHVLPQVEAVLRDRLTFPKQHLRLLKIRADRSAFEVAGRHVRTNQSYLLITAHRLREDIVQSLALSPMQTNLSETHLWQLDVEQNLSSKQIEALESLELGYVLGVRMEPLGLSPRWNPGNGAMVFLDTETALFSLTSDVAVQEFSVSIDTSPPVRFKPSAGGKTYISLGTLAIGPHSITASALGVATGANIVAEEVAIDVRSSIPWQHAIAGKAGVSLSLEPRQARLEQLFDGEATIRITAPPGRNVKLYSRFYGADGTLFHEEKIGCHTTPISDQKLRELVVRKLTSNAQVEYLERAVRIELAISLDEYGAESITFEKDAEPLRWVRLNETKVRLSDDSAEETKPIIECYDLNAAEKVRTVSYQEALDGIELNGRGGLLIATHEARCYTAVATVIQSQLRSFSDLGIPAILSTANIQLTDLITALRRWHSARRLLGSMAFIARRNAIRALEQRLELSLCGEDWIRAANLVRNNPQSIGDLYRLVFYSLGYAAGLRAHDWRYEADEAGALSEFVRLSKVYKVCNNEPLCGLALKLAFTPSAIPTSELPSKNAFEALKTNPPLIRGAYFARLAADMRAQGAALEAA